MAAHGVIFIRSRGNGIRWQGKRWYYQNFSFNLFSLTENKLVIRQKRGKKKPAKKGGCVHIKGYPGISQEFLQENSTSCYDDSKVSITESFANARL